MLTTKSENLRASWPAIIKTHLLFRLFSWSIINIFNSLFLLQRKCYCWLTLIFAFKLCHSERAIITNDYLPLQKELHFLQVPIRMPWHSAQYQWQQFARRSYGCRRKTTEVIVDKSEGSSFQGIWVGTFWPDKWTGMTNFFTFCISVKGPIYSSPEVVLN